MLDELELDVEDDDCEDTELCDELELLDVSDEDETELKLDEL